MSVSLPGSRTRAASLAFAALLGIVGAPSATAAAAAPGPPASSPASSSERAPAAAPAPGTVAPATAPPPAVAPSPIASALARFEAGDYDAVVATLRPVVENDALPDPATRAQALRVYGIACVLTRAPLAAEAAFLRWLEVEPRARLDPALVRPEVVAFFDHVRAAHRDELLRDVERRRPRTAILNLLPPAGQYQNGQHGKFAILLGSEIALAALSVGTYVALGRMQHADGQVDDEPTFELVRATNWVATLALAGVLLYAIVDGFAVHGRIVRALDRDEDGLRAARSPTTPDAPRGPALRLSTGGVALAF